MICGPGFPSFCALPLEVDSVRGHGGPTTLRSQALEGPRWVTEPQSLVRAGVGVVPWPPPVSG